MSTGRDKYMIVILRKERKSTKIDRTRRYYLPDEKGVVDFIEATLKEWKERPPRERLELHVYDLVLRMRVL